MKITEVNKIAAGGKPMNEFPLMEASSDHIVLFHPHVPSGAAQAVAQVFSMRWIVQGPRVE
jgi:hypothetical protein